MQTNKIILAMIAGNEEAVLPRCIESFAAAIDGLVIVWARGNREADGSEAAVRAVCSRLNIPVAFSTYTNRPEAADWPHVDDFAAARNAAYQGAICFGESPAGIEPGWILWADADDQLAPGSAGLIRHFAETAEEDVLFFTYILDANGGHTKRERMCRPAAFYSWIGRVHERCVWMPETREAYFPEVCYMHNPLVSKTGGSTRNLRILEAIPEDSRTGRDFFYLYSEYSNQRQIAKAIEAGIIATERDDVHLEEKFSIFLTMGKWIKDLEGAERPILEAQRLCPWRREPYAELARLHLSRPDGAPRKALGYIHAMRGIPHPEGMPMWHNPALYAWEADDLLELALWRAGRQDEATAKRRGRFKEHGRRISVIHTTQNPDQAVFLRGEWLSRAADPSSVEWIFALSPELPDVESRLEAYPHAVGDFSTEDSARNAGRLASIGRLCLHVEDDIHPPQGWDIALWAACKKQRDVELDFEALIPFGFARAGKVPWKRQSDTTAIRISVVHPTVRPEQAIRVKEQWLAAAKHPDRIEYIFGTEPTLAAQLAGHTTCVSEPVPAGHASAVANYNAAAAAATGQIIIAAQDDIQAPEGWDVDVARELSDCLERPAVLHVHDGHRDDKLMVIMCVTRPYLEQQGYLLCPEYDGYWSDTEFSFRAYHAAIVHDGRHIRFYHDHPAFTGAKSDAEYMRQHNPEACARGEAIFRRRNPDSKW